MSASTPLGITALIYSSGMDGYIYLIAFFAGWPVLLLLMTERLRNLGRFTFADITSYRLDQGKVRTMAAIGSLTVVCFYLVAQMVGAGQLIRLLFGLDYQIALVIVGALMMLYVTFGGMVGNRLGADRQSIPAAGRRLAGAVPRRCANSTSAMTGWSARRWIAMPWANACWPLVACWPTC